MKLSKLASNLQPSATLSVSTKAKNLKKQGKNVISFGTGEPDFDSPKAVREGAIAAIDRGESHYTPAAGIPELREAVASYYKKRFGLSFSPSQVIVGAGAKPLVYEALACVMDPGDEILLPVPAWVSYVEQARMVGGKAVPVETQDTTFIPKVSRFEELLTEKTAALLINSPCNPTGAVYDAGTLGAIAHFAIQHDLWILFDEIYERLVYGDAIHRNLLQVVPEAAERTILINGASKAFAMTGWRIGYALGPQPVIDKMIAMQGHLTSNPCSIAQWAALEALERAEEDVERMRDAFEKRRASMVEALSKMPKIRFQVPSGAFYVFVDIRDTALPDDLLFCDRLLEEEYVAAVPGRGFMAPGFLRLSYANSLEEILEGMKRLGRFLERLEGV